jgi:hypothetical protein
VYMVPSSHSKAIARSGRGYQPGLVRLMVVRPHCRPAHRDRLRRAADWRKASSPPWLQKAELPQKAETGRKLALPGPDTTRRLTMLARQCPAAARSKNLPQPAQHIAVRPEPAQAVCRRGSSPTG